MLQIIATSTKQTCHIFSFYALNTIQLLVPGTNDISKTDNLLFEFPANITMHGFKWYANSMLWMYDIWVPHGNILDGFIIFASVHYGNITAVWHVHVMTWQHHSGMTCACFNMTMSWHENIMINKYANILIYAYLMQQVVGDSPLK